MESCGRDGQLGFRRLSAGGYSPGYLLVTLPGSGSTAVSFNLMSYTAGKNVLVTLANGEFFSVPT